MVVQESNKGNQRSKCAGAHRTKKAKKRKGNMIIQEVN